MFFDKLKLIRNKSINGSLRAGQIISRQYSIDADCSNQNVFWLISNPGDEIQQEQIKNSFYEFDLLKKISSYIGNPKIIYDIGANIGNHSIYFSKRHSPDKIVLIEPFSEAIRHLLINVSLNYHSCFDLSYLGFGVSLKSGTATIQPPSQFNIGLTKLIPGNNGAVPLVTVDSISSENLIDFVKIDVEGMEMDALLGMQNTISRCKPSVFVEVADRNVELVDKFMFDYEYELAYEQSDYEGMTNKLYMAK